MALLEWLPLRLCFNLLSCKVTMLHAVILALAYRLKIMHYGVNLRTSRINEIESDSLRRQKRMISVRQ
jgi:hypothetical protein